jgi:SAM-dependent MidA family methyltransferase
MSLKARLRAEIAAAGPISLAEFMTRCLHDPADGYYATPPPRRSRRCSAS